MGYHRILKVNELRSSSSSISILKNNASVFTTFQINDKDLDETGGLNTQYTLPLLIARHVHYLQLVMMEA